jgi:hypothetical protein
MKQSQPRSEKRSRTDQISESRSAETEVRGPAQVSGELRRSCPRYRRDTSTSKRKGNNLKGSEDFSLKPKARIWPWPSGMCHIRSTEFGGESRKDPPERTYILALGR